MKRILVGWLSTAAFSVVLGCGVESEGDRSVDVVDAGAAGVGTQELAPDAGTASEPRLLASYAEVYDALIAGKEVRVVLQYGRCTLDGAGAGPDVIGGMDVDVFEAFARNVVGNPKAYVAFSESRLVLVGQSRVVNYVKVRLFEDGKVGIVAEYLDPQTYEVSMHETFDCVLADAAESTAGAWFFLR